MPTDTKTSLLDAAETLFAEEGIAAASMRKITKRADANLAAAHYHFGSKEALLRAVLARRMRPINEERLTLLDDYERRPAEKRTLHDLVTAFVAPVIRHGREMPMPQRVFAQLIGRAIGASDNTLRTLLIAELAEVIKRFKRAFGDALPHLTQAELLWRIHFTIGAVAHTLAGAAMLEAVSEGQCDTDDLDTTVARLVPFLVAAFEAPATTSDEERDA